MHYPSSTLTATLRALRGVADPHIVAPTLGDQRFAHILALAPGVDPVIGALGALAGEVPDLLVPGAIESPALHAAIASLIGTDVGERVLEVWAEVAPAGWGAPHATALIDAVRDAHCAPWVAAALIGPCDASAALLSQTWDIARAVQHWGRTPLDLPTAWMEGLSSTEWKRLVNMLTSNGSSALSAAAICLPWLPRHCVAEIAEHIAGMSLLFALDAYACASPIARACHANILASLIQRAERYHLVALTRLAVATSIDAAWDAVVRHLRTHPRYAASIVAAAPWDDVRPDVQDIILSAADNDSTSICAAIAYALGMRSDHPTITRETARAFFAAVTLEVWDALTEEKKRMWLSTLDKSNAPLAVWSLGLDPAFLKHAMLDDDLIVAARRHAPHEETLRWTLLPLTVCDLPIADVPAVIAALPASPDPVAFVQIAGRMWEMSPALRDWITAHSTPQTQGATITALHAAAKHGTLVECCGALAHALAGWSWKETHALLDALPDDVCDALRPDPDVIAERLTPLHRRGDFLQALDSLAALPPSVAISAYHALHVLATMQRVGDHQHAGEGLAQALRAYGDCFLAIVDALAVEHQAKVLPVPDNETQDDIRALASADPLVAHRLAHALHKSDPTAILDALETAGAQDMRRLWRCMSEALRRTISGDIDALASAAATPEHANALAQALRGWNANDPLALLALRLLIDDNPDGTVRGVAMLAQRPNVAASLLPLLHENLRVRLESVPAIALDGADLPPSRSPAPVRRRRC